MLCRLNVSICFNKPGRSCSEEKTKMKKTKKANEEIEKIERKN